MEAPNHCVALHEKRPPKVRAYELTKAVITRQRGLPLHEIPCPDNSCPLSKWSLSCNTISRGEENIDSKGLHLQVICRLAAGPIEKVGDGDGRLLAKGRPPQTNIGSNRSSSGSIRQLRDTECWLASELAIYTVHSIEAVWSLTGRKVSGSQENEGPFEGAQRCTNGKPHIVVLSVTQLPLSCDPCRATGAENPLSNLSAACYCRCVSSTQQDAKLSIGIAPDEAPDN